MRIPEAEQQEILKGGQSRVRNQIQWAKFYLASAGYIDSSKRGIWNLTEKGLSADTLTFDALGILKKSIRAIKRKRNKRTGETPDWGSSGGRN